MLHPLVSLFTTITLPTLKGNSVPCCRFGQTEAQKGRFQRDQSDGRSFSQSVLGLIEFVGTRVVVIHMQTRRQILSDAQHLYPTGFCHWEAMAGRSAPAKYTVTHLIEA